MKKLLQLTFLLFVSFAISSCSDEMPTQSPVVRDYQSDAQVLAKFVDVNKTLGEYYINENKKISPMAYITNSDWEELQQVNPLNRARYENELKALNAQIAFVVQRSDVDQIVYTTYGETWVREIADSSPIIFKKSQLTTRSAISARSSYGRLNLLYNTQQWLSFNAGNLVRMRIDINLNSYTYYFFEIICDTNASKSGSSAGGTDPKKIVMSGTTSMETWEYTWTENTGASDVYWEFKGKRNSPQNIGAQITAELYD